MSNRFYVQFGDTQDVIGGVEDMGGYSHGGGGILRRGGNLTARGGLSADDGGYSYGGGVISQPPYSQTGGLGRFYVQHAQVFSSLSLDH